jgi:putative endonuclease
VYLNPIGAPNSQKSCCLDRSRGLHRSLGVAPPKLTVYVLRSVPHPARYYSGVTSDIAVRLAEHNAGRSRYTSGLRPWELVAAIEFGSESSALAFERYLKTGSGRAFAKRHFV